MTDINSTNAGHIEHIDQSAALVPLKLEPEHQRELQNTSLFMIIAAVVSLLAGLASVASIVNILGGALVILGGVWLLIAGLELSKISKEPRIDRERLRKTVHMLRNFFLLKAILIIIVLVAFTGIGLFLIGSIFF